MENNLKTLAEKIDALNDELETALTDFLFEARKVHKVEYAKHRRNTPTGTNASYAVAQAQWAGENVFTRARAVARDEAVPERVFLKDRV